MAQKIITQLVDDTTGEDIAPGEGETISFALDNQAYSLDLTTKNAEKFRSLLQDYIAVASKQSRPRSRAGARGSGSSSSAPASEVRAWARENGWPDLGERGRIPADARDAFNSR